MAHRIAPLEIDYLRGKNRRPRQTKASHLEWIRTLPCLVTGIRFEIDAAHIRYADHRFAKRMVGLQEKPDDRWVVPLTREEHKIQHSMNERGFWIVRGIDPTIVAAALWIESGNDEAAEIILNEARNGANS